MRGCGARDRLNALHGPAGRPVSPPRSALDDGDGPQADHQLGDTRGVARLHHVGLGQAGVKMNLHMCVSALCAWCVKICWCPGGRFGWWVTLPTQMGCSPPPLYVFPPFIAPSKRCLSKQVGEEGSWTGAGRTPRNFRIFFQVLSEQPTLGHHIPSLQVGRDTKSMLSPRCLSFYFAPPR